MGTRIAFLGLGRMGRELATHLNLSEASVRTYTRRILELTGCSTRTELVLHAARGLPGSR